MPLVWLSNSRYLRNNVLSTLASHGDAHAVNYSLTGFKMWMKNQRYYGCFVRIINVETGAHQMEPQSPLISWLNPLPSRFINRTILFWNALEFHECACCLLFDVRQYYCHFSIFTGSFLYQRAKAPQGKGWRTPRACMGGSIWWVPGLKYNLT